MDSPPPISASTAGAPLQAKEAAETAESRRAAQHHAGRRLARTVDEAGVTVETSDADARVFSDTEGAGSQGRDLSQEQESDPEAQSGAPPTGITQDKDGQLHLDLQA